jgi:hypothetical protein
MINQDLCGGCRAVSAREKLKAEKLCILSLEETL